jgi:hypothetical protein
MAIHVYKAGNKHTVNGVKCEIVTCVDVADMEANLAAGCVHDEKDLYKDEKEVKKSDKPQKEVKHGTTEG